jgi:hypothetical protein
VHTTREKERELSPRQFSAGDVHARHAACTDQYNYFTYGVVVGERDEKEVMTQGSDEGTVQ